MAIFDPKHCDLAALGIKPEPKVEQKGAYQPPMGVGSDDVIQRAALTGHMPSWWVSDHLKELEHFTGWTYIAVHAKAKQYKECLVSVFDDTSDDVPDTGSQKRTPQPKHDIARLLKRPNAMQSKGEFFYQIGLQISLTGGCIIWEVRNQWGKPCELWIIPRGWVRPIPRSDQYPVGAWYVNPIMQSWMYSSTTAGTGPFTLDMRNTMTIGWPHPIYPGERQSPVSACSQLIDIAEELDNATFAAFVNEVKPGIVLSVDARVPFSKEQDANIKTVIDNMKAGTSNARKILYAQGLSVDNLNRPVSELDHIAGRAQMRDAVLAIHQVPPIAAGITEAGTYSAFVAALNQFIELSVQPDLSLIADAFTHRWSHIFGEDFEIELKAKRFDDPQIELQKVDRMLNGLAQGVWNVNEIRAQFSDGPIDHGDVFAMQPELLNQAQMLQQMGSSMGGQQQMPGQMPGGPVQTGPKGNEQFNQNEAQNANDMALAGDGEEASDPFIDNTRDVRDEVRTGKGRTGIGNPNFTSANRMKELFGS